MPVPVVKDITIKIWSEKEFPPLPAPVMMDKVTKARLEAISKQTPRYLFRLWSKASEKPSGGYHGLNTTTAITPLAFFKGQGHESAYHLTKLEFTDIAQHHLKVLHIATEFSSWSASLVFILNKCPGTDNASRGDDGLYVSIIDVEMLQETNQIFYVPLLDFLKPGKWSYPHEYLIHGIVKGPWYKALPYVSFTNLRICHHLTIGASFVNPVTKDEVQHARKIGNLFGSEFALPITLAILCCLRRDQEFWMHGVGTKDLDTVIRGIWCLKVPESWRKRHSIVGHAISPQNFSDTKQVTMLIRTLMKHFKETNYSNGQVRSQSEPPVGKRSQFSTENGHTECAKPKDEDKEDGGVTLKYDTEISVDQDGRISIEKADGKSKLSLVEMLYNTLRGIHELEQDESGV